MKIARCYQPDKPHPKFGNLNFGKKFLERNQSTSQVGLRKVL